MARIAFVQEEVRDRFSVMIFASLLKRRGHACEVFIAESDKDFINSIKVYNPDIVGFSTMSPGIDFALRTARDIKKRCGAFIIMGGAHPTFYPDVILEDCLDSICIGEGEHAMIELAESIRDGINLTSIRNLWVKEGSKVHKNDVRELIDLDSLPMMDYGIYFDKYPELRNAPTKKVSIGRGCPFSCTYCFNSSLKKLYSGKGEYVRFRDVDNIITEIMYLKETYGFKWLQITTDTININRTWFLKFLESYKKNVNVPFMCNIRVDLIDEDIVKKMKEAGCDRVDYGIEHGDEWIRKNVLGRRMSNDNIVSSGKLFNKYGIRVQTTNIIAVPHETVESAMKTVELNRKVNPEVAHSFILQPYVGTEIHRYSIENDFLGKDYKYSKSGNTFQVEFDGAAISVPLKLKESRKLINIFLLFDVFVKHKWLTSIASLLIKLPPNRIFKLIFMWPMVMRDIKYSESKSKKKEHALKLMKVLFN